MIGIIDSIFHLLFKMEDFMTISKILLQIISFIFNFIILLIIIFLKLDDLGNFCLLFWISIVVVVLYLAIYKFVQKKDLGIVYKFKVLPGKATPIWTNL